MFRALLLLQRRRRRTVAKRSARNEATIASVSCPSSQHRVSSAEPTLEHRTTTVRGQTTGTRQPHALAAFGSPWAAATSDDASPLPADVDTQSFESIRQSTSLEENAKQKDNEILQCVTFCKRPRRTEAMGKD